MRLGCVLRIVFGTRGNFFQNAKLNKIFNVKPYGRGGKTRHTNYTFTERSRREALK